MAGDNPAPRGGRLLVLPPLLHGPSDRGRLSEARASRIRPPHSGAWYLPVVSLRGPSPRRGGPLAQGSRREAPAYGLELGGQSASWCRRLVRKTNEGAGAVRRDLDLLFHPGSGGRA